MEDFTLLDKRSVSDGMGGFTIKYLDGATVKCGLTLDSSMQSLVAQSQGVTSVYTLITARDVLLPFHQVLRRESDKKTFRVTSDATDQATPQGADLKVRKVSAESWVLENE